MKDLLWLIYFIVITGLAVFYNFLPWNAVVTFSIILVSYFVMIIITESEGINTEE